MTEKYQIIAFYEFIDLQAVRPLEESQTMVREAMLQHGVRGTVILSAEGFNSTICGLADQVRTFAAEFEAIFKTRLTYKSSFHETPPFRKTDVKIRPEIVSLRQKVDISTARGTHVSAADWNALMADENVLVLDTRNYYEFKNGTFRGAINPETSKFSDLPEFVEQNSERFEGKKIAMFCTGGIRCEKFAPYLIAKGFRDVYQLEGGILKYLEQIEPSESLWEGECFVFDARRTVDEKLEKGTGPDYSQKPNGAAEIS